MQSKLNSGARRLRGMHEQTQAFPRPFADKTLWKLTPENKYIVAS